MGGPIESRGESLRRAAAEGLAIICLHPPGRDSEPYYQVALSREETGASIVPDLPLRLHPGVTALRQALLNGELGPFRALRYEGQTGSAAIDLTRTAFPRAVDVVRALVGEIEALTATGDPPGEDPDYELVVQLRASESRRAEVRIRSETAGPARLTLQAANGSLTLEIEPADERGCRLIRQAAPRAPEVIELEPWDPHEAIFGVLLSSVGRHEGANLPGPNLQDATRTMELAEAAVRSLRRGRTIELHYEAISEDATFKSVMTSTGCMILLAMLFVLPLSMAGPPLGLKWTLFIPYFILPILVIFVVMQLLRLAVRRPAPSSSVDPARDQESRPNEGLRSSGL